MVTKLTRSLSIISISLILLLLLVITGVTPILAQTETSAVNNPATLFYQANNYYLKADYQKALESYLQLIQVGYESGSLYFNLGNTYFKLGQKGLAILYYEKARQLIPDDADLKANLAYTLTGVDEGTVNWKTEFFTTLAYIFPLGTWLVISSISFFLLAIFIIIRVLLVSNTTKLPVWELGILIAISVILLVSVGFATLTYLEQIQPKAVTIQADGAIRFEPSPTSTLYFHLAEGTRVKILDRKDNWYLIKRNDGKRGWIEQQYLGRI